MHICVWEGDTIEIEKGQGGQSPERTEYWKSLRRIDVNFSLNI